MSPAGQGALAARDLHLSSEIVKEPRVLRVVDLLRPHWKAMTMALVGVGGAAVADLLEPWPIKIVLDYALASQCADPHPG